MHNLSRRHLARVAAVVLPTLEAAVVVSVGVGIIMALQWWQAK